MLRLDVQNQEWTGPLGASTKFGKIMHDPFIPYLSLFISNGCYTETNSSNSSNQGEIWPIN